MHKILTPETIKNVKNRPSFKDDIPQFNATIKQVEAAETAHDAFIRKYNEQKNDFLFSCICYLGYKGDRNDREALRQYAREIGLEIQVEYNNIRCLEIYTVKCKKKNYEQTAIFNYSIGGQVLDNG